MHQDLVVYGSYGYTGRLIVAEALARGHRPLLAGRDPDKLAAQAADSALEYRAVALDDRAALRALLTPATCVLHCAGPFTHTSRPMVDACIETGTHYLDITGEVDVFESVAARGAEAAAAGTVLMPGVGFDVVPSDSVAARLARELPDAVELTLAIRGGGRLSRGTATTMAINAGRGGAVRRDGRIVKVPAGWKTRMIDYGDGPQLAVTIPWGDVSTAWHTTGIPNIAVYSATTAKQLRALRATRWLAPLLRLNTVKHLLTRRIAAGAPGPSERSLASTTSEVWGEARAADGRTATALFKGPNGYALTARTAVRIAELVAAGAVQPGFRTPAGALGPDFVLSIPGVSVE